MTDISVLQQDSWPEGKLDTQHGDAEVLCLCDMLKVERRGSIQGFLEYKELRTSKTPAALEPLLEAVHTIAVSTSDRERTFGNMNDILTAQKEQTCYKPTFKPGFSEMQQTTTRAVQSTK